MSDPTPFEVVSEFKPTGDQPRAIDELAARLGRGDKAACLLGATGTGKTFTMANVIARLGRPTLIISHNKTLAAQLYEELREFFPKNSVNYFVSYYDYYQPEAYIPQRDIYIEKDASRNDDLDRLRLAATSNILGRQDTIVVASVSCIFGLGSPKAYGQKVLSIAKGQTVSRRDLLVAMNDMQYQRSDIDFKRGTYRVRGDAVEVHPAYEKFSVRVELFGDEIDRIELIEPISGELLAEESIYHLFPAVHHVMPEDQLEAAVTGIAAELDEQVRSLRSEGKLLEAQRLLARTKYDMEMLREVGFCSGIENYSRYMDGRQPGEKPYTLLDYFDYAPGGKHSATPSPDASNWLLIIDESHVTIPQVHAMYNGDRNRKLILVEHGFRLPSALDNRPLKFEEFEEAIPQLLFVSATPSKYELEKTGGEVVEQIIRPTGLVDPRIEIKPAKGQVADLLEQCRERAEQGDRVLVTALTKRLCEDLTNYLDEQGLRVRYLHSEIETLERLEILTELREGEFDVLVGVNLLREGLDLPEVSLVCILDADKEGFLRSATSLIQQMGRAARNVDATVIMYADTVTPSMQAAIDETNRRREAQLAYNQANNITPATIIKSIRRGIESELKAQKTARAAVAKTEEAFAGDELVRMLTDEMLEAAQSLEFEKAAALRDQLDALKQRLEKDQGLTMTRTEVEEMLGQQSTSRRPGQAGSRKGRKRKQKRS